jgi:hypothetical protein
MKSYDVQRLMKLDATQKVDSAKQKQSGTNEKEGLLKVKADGSDDEFVWG